MKVTADTRKTVYLHVYQLLHTQTDQSPGVPLSFTYGVASLQLATARAAALGVGGVVFLHREDGGCLGNRWCSPVEGRGWHQSRGETLTGDIHRLRLLLQPADGQTKHRGTSHYYRVQREKRCMTLTVQGRCVCV